MESIISQMLKSNEINLGYAKPYRNFIFIEDLLDFYEVMIENYEKAAEGKVFCCGPNNPIRISDLADKIAKKLKWTGKINWDQDLIDLVKYIIYLQKTIKLKSYLGGSLKLNLMRELIEQ